MSVGNDSNTRPLAETYRPEIVDERRVPWIALWSGEKAELPLMSGRGGVRYDDPVVDAMFRDARGVLWQLDAMTNRTGVPDFGRVNGSRARLAACTGVWRCQVCGEPTDSPEWLLTPELMTGSKHFNGDTMATTNLPNCAECFAEAVASCPHLSSPNRDVVRVEPERASWVGWLADYYDLDQGGRPERGVFTFAAVDAFPFLLAKQPIMKLVGGKVTAL